MFKTVILEGKPVRVELTGSAQRSLDHLQNMLVAEIHLILGCMVVKRILFKESIESKAEIVNIMGNLVACFRTVRYSKNCRISHIDSGDEQPIDFPLVVGKDLFVPQWVRIDYKGGNWVGTFGYEREPRQVSLKRDSLNTVAIKTLYLLGHIRLSQCEGIFKLSLYKT